LKADIAKYRPQLAMKHPWIETQVIEC